MKINQTALVKLFKDALTKEVNSLQSIQDHSHIYTGFCRVGGKIDDLEAYCEQRAQRFLRIEDEDDLVAYFQKLLQGKITSLDEGICTNFLLPADIKQTCFILWDKFSGDITFPVPNRTRASAELEYTNAATFEGDGFMWGDNQYGKARRELLAFMQQKVSELISE